MASQTPEELFDLGVKSIEARDYIQAKKYFEKACDLKYGGGCGALGDLYDDVEKNLIKAAQLYSKACDLNNSVGCGALGMLYEFGQGVEKNLTKATQLYSKACKLGFQKTCEILKELK
ncbi:tetratricopeptide repeat protein [Helicobacter pylori]|uniref:tetratricopeptide repeat protein n=1 Tax=Helicobacter pylori TaxID=210 RepID=UPI0011987E2F|nr:tetratricopeptide repeat protein [Helicobacter pylori]QDY59550.1 sel1 repeat family protein [Helicobacter pylori]